MATRAPFGGAAVQSAGPNTAESLAVVKQCLEARKPWPAFLLVGTEVLDGWEDCPEDAQDALGWIASVVGLLDIASVGPLTPVCQAFKGLIEAVGGAAEAQEKLRELVSWCAFLIRVFMKLSKTVGARSDISSSLRDFVSTTDRLAKRARTLATRHKVSAMFLHRKDTKEIASFEVKLRNIWADVRGLSLLDARETLDDMRPPRLAPMADIPPGALALPDSHVERTALVDEVVRALTVPDAADSSTSHLLLGMGGGGKTVLASSVVRHEAVRKHFRQGVFWVRVGVGGKGQLHALWQGLARDVGAAQTDTPHGVPHGFNSLDDVVQHLTAVARAGSAPRLVVLDDVWEREVVDALLPTGLVLLVTTRDRSVAVRGGCTKVGDMTEDESVTLLGRASEIIGSPGAAALAGMHQVARDCGCSPLALAIVGSMPVVKGHGSSPQAWQELREHLKDSSRDMQLAEGDAAQTIDHVLNASFVKLGKAKREALESMAVLPKGAVAPVDMLLNLWDIDDIADCRDIAQGLVGRSLLQRVGIAGYRVHDLVLDFLNHRIQSARLGTAASRQARYLGRLDVVLTYAGTGRFHEGYYSLMALWRRVEEASSNPDLQGNTYGTSLASSWEEESVDAAKVFWAVGRLLEYQGKFKEADVRFERALAIFENVYGRDHENMAVHILERAALLNEQGKYEDADLLFKRALAIGESVYGQDHKLVSTVLNDRALLLMDQGKFEEAGLLFRRALAIDEKMSGRDHPEVAIILSNQAGLLAKKGKLDDADLLYKRALAINEKVYGPDHQQVAITLGNRARLLRDQGKLDDADLLYRRTLAINEKVYGPDHQKVAITLGNRARLLRDQGKFDDADLLYKRALVIKEKVYGADHHEVAYNLILRARLLQDQGKLDSADLLYRRALAINEKVYGPDHQKVTVILIHRARLLRDQGKLEEADLLYRRALAIEEKAYGYDHQEVAATLNYRAGLLGEQGKYEEADLLFTRILAIREKVYGMDHQQVAATLFRRAGVLGDQGRYEEADLLYKRALEISEKIYGPDHHNVAITLHDRAYFLEEQGKHEESIILLQRAVAIYEKVHGPGHPEVATSLKNWAVALKSQKHFAEADVLFQRSLAILDKVYGPDHQRVAKCLRQRARMLQDQGKYDEAGVLHDRAIALLEKALGSNHPEVAISLNYRGLLFKLQALYDEASASHQRALSIDEKAYGCKHPRVAEDRNYIAELFRHQGRYEKAAPLYERAIGVWEAVRVSEHPNMAEVLANKAELLTAQGKRELAVPLLERALAIRLKAFGKTHKDTVESQARLDQARQPQAVEASALPESE